MIKARGVHHIAFSTADMKGQLEYFSDVLGMPLVAIFPMHGVPGGIHAFLEGSPECLISFVQLPAIADIEIEYGKTHAGSGALPSAPGTLQHLAMVVDTDDELLAMRDRIEGLTIIVIEHEMGVIERITDRCVVLNYGEKISEGSYREIAADPFPAFTSRGDLAHRRAIGTIFASTLL